MVRPDEDRAKRLAAALRENLKRRKAEAREGAAGPAAPNRHPDESQDP